MRKTILYFKYMNFCATNHSPSTYHFKCNAKKNSNHSEATKTKWYRFYPSLTQIEIAMHAPALVQQFTHLVHPKHSHRLSYLLRKNAFMTEKNTTTESRQTQGKKQRANSIRDVQLTLSLVVVEMVVDGGGHFSPASYRWFTHMSLLLSSSTAHSRAVGNPHTHNDQHR